MFMLKETGLLKSVLKKIEFGFQSVMITGDVGIGKSTLTDYCLNGKNRLIILIEQRMGMSAPFEALECAISEYIFNDDSQEKNSLPYKEYLKKMLIKLCEKTENVFVVFRDVREFDKNLILLCEEALTYAKISKKIHNCVFIFEFSTDLLSEELKAFRINLATKCNNPAIDIKERTREDLELLLFSLLDNKCKICKNKIDELLKESFYNPASITRLVYHLKDLNDIYSDEKGYWNCKDIDIHSTVQLFEEQIKRRIESLEPQLRKVLEKACITGYIVDIKLLCNPLRVFKTVENLNRIERISHLIINEKKEYSFENQEVYHTINNSMDYYEKLSLHRIIAEYLIVKLNSGNTQYKINSTTLKDIYMIAFHYDEAEQFELSLHYWLLYTHYALLCKRYEATQESILRINEIVDFNMPILNEYCRYLNVRVDSLLGKSINSLSNFEEKFEIFPKSFIQRMNYEHAYNLFKENEINSAIEILTAVINEGDKHSTNYSRIKSITLLAGVYHHIGERVKAERHYEWAKSETYGKRIYEKDYYYLSLCSGMFYTAQIAISIMDEALNYFQTNNMTVPLARCFSNIAVEYLYVFDTQKAFKCFERSIELFSDVCSFEEHYPLNNIGMIYAERGNYKKALECFENAHNMSNEYFSKIWTKINISVCSRVLGDKVRSLSILKECESELSKETEDTSLIQRNLNIAYALYYESENNFDLALKFVKSAFEIETEILHNDTYVVFLAKLIIEFSQKTESVLQENIVKYEKAIVSKFIESLLKTKTHWGLFMFWEW